VFETAEFQIHQSRYQPNLTFDFGDYDYWRLWILAGIHGIKGFVIPTKSFVKIGITKIFCYNKIFSSINKTFGCYNKIFGCSNKKKIFVVPNFVAVTKPFFSVTALAVLNFGVCGCRPFQKTLLFVPSE